MPIINRRPGVINRFAIGVVAALALTSCGALNSEVTSVDAGILIYQGKTATISAPDTATHGTPFQVNVQTFGTDCTQGVDHDDVRTNGLSVEIDPYNKSAASATCTGGGFTSITHIVSVTVTSTGTATIKVVGLTDDPPVGATTNLTSLTRTVVIQ
jgi:hypothetical protein